MGEEAHIFPHAPQMFVAVPAAVHLPRPLRLEYCACFRRAENAMGLAFGFHPCASWRKGLVGTVAVACLAYIGVNTAGAPHC